MSMIRSSWAVAAVLLQIGGGDVCAADIAFGQYLSGECATCHRADGQDKGIPPIVGWPTDQFVAVLKSYKDKDRPHAIMQTVAGKLSPDEMAALAAYYASLTVKK
jgi:cytochrome c